MSEAIKQALALLQKGSSLDVPAAIEVLKQAEKQTHTDHPMRHWDRTCPACIVLRSKNT